MCCVRVPDEDRPGRRLQGVESYSTMTRPLLSMADRALDTACTVHLTGLGHEPGP